MSSLKQLQKDENTQFKHSVFGYIRRYEKRNKTITIPIMIKYICLSYYLFDEKFTKHADHLIINDTQNIVTNHNDAYNTVYGNVKIDIKDKSILEYSWKFKVLFMPKDSDYNFLLGIDASNFSMINGTCNAGLCRLFDFNKGAVFGPDCFITYYTPAIGDEIDMICNVYDKKLLLKINGKEIINDSYVLPIDFKNKEYRMTLTMSRNQQSMQLLQFNIKQWVYLL